MSKIDRKESDQNVIKLANKNAGMNSYTQNSDRLSLPIEIWKLIKVYKQVLIICMMASVTAYFAYYLYSKPKYKASATIGATTKRAYKTVNEALGYLMNSTDEELNGNINAIIDYFNSPEAKNLIEERLLKSKIDDEFLAQSKLDAILANHGFERSLQRVDVLLRDGAKILNLVEIKVFSNPDTRTVIAEAISSNPELAMLAANITAKVLVE